MTAGHFIRAWGVDTRTNEGANRRIVVQNLPTPVSIEELKTFFGADGIEGITIFSLMAFVQFKRPTDHTQSLLKNMERWRGKEIKISPFKRLSKERHRSTSPPSPMIPVERREHQRHRPREKSSERRDRDRSIAVYRDRTSVRAHASTSHHEQSLDRNRHRSSNLSRERSLTKDHSYSSHRDNLAARTRSRSRSQDRMKMRPSSSSAKIRPENGTPMSGVRLEPMTETDRLWSNFPAQRTFAGEPFAHSRQTLPYPIQQPQPQHQPMPQFQSVPAFQPTLALPRIQSQPQLPFTSQPLSIEAAPSNGDTAVLPDRIKLLMDIVRQGNSVRAASVDQIKELEKYFHDSAIEMEARQQTSCLVEPALSQSGDSTCNDSAINGTQEGPSREEALLQLANKIRGFHS